MAFRNSNMTAHLIRFNSAVSSDFLDQYNTIVKDEITAKNSEPKHKTFAPSQMRCDRVSWFRLRGTQPDKIKKPDVDLDFTAQIGTACHEAIQKRLSEHFKEDWISVESWIQSNPDKFKDYQLEISSKGYESLIDMKYPFPVRFACDGIVNFQGKVRLLEIKTAEFSSLQDLTGPKSKHIDQVECYSTLLQIPDVIFLYQERQYGALKCFEYTVSELKQQEVSNRMQHVLDLVEANIAPDGLPIGDPDCSQSMCPYYAKCKEWGR